MTKLRRFLNHSCIPNARLAFDNDQIFTRPAKFITAGEEITIDYLVHQNRYADHTGSCVSNDVHDFRVSQTETMTKDLEELAENMFGNLPCRLQALLVTCQTCLELKTVLTNGLNKPDALTMVIYILEHCRYLRCVIHSRLRKQPRKIISSLSLASTKRNTSRCLQRYQRSIR